MAKRDYYEILGLDKAADEPALKSAYRKMALQFHPDRNPNNKDAEEKFKEAAEAYSVLSDSQKRAAYDRFGFQGVPSAGAGGGGFDPNAFADFSDILGDFFGLNGLFGNRGQQQRRNGPARGEDLRYDLEVKFEDMMKGLAADIQVPRVDPCSRCSGTGGEPQDGMTVCPMCRGRGEVIFQQSFLSVRRTCTQCEGRGQLIRRPCVQCRGEGYLRSERKLKINIPAGVDNGTRLRLTGEGQPGAKGGPPGDLYVIIKVEDHPVFERKDSDLHCTVPINIAQAALGTNIDLLTFDGLVSVKIPEGSQHGSSVKVRNHGVPVLNGHGKGDLYVHVEVKVPSKLNRDQRKLLETLRETLPEENEPAERGIFDKVKDYFM